MLLQWFTIRFSTLFDSVMVVNIRRWGNKFRNKFNAIKTQKLRLQIVFSQGELNVSPNYELSHWRGIISGQIGFRIGDLHFCLL